MKNKLNEKKILNIIGKILKWFFLFEAACFFMVLLVKIVKLSFDDFGGYFFTALACLLIAFGGYRIERFGRSEKAEETPVKPPLKEEPAPKKDLVQEKDSASESVYKPVTGRSGIVSNGNFRYEFRTGEDLFPAGKEGLAYPELPWNFQVAANLGKHMLDTGGVITGISIGGGSTEVSHTGAVAYRNFYATLESFVDKSMQDMEEAEREADMEYGSWFTGLDFKYIIIKAKRNETEIKVEVSCFVPQIWVEISLGHGGEGFAYLADLVREFGAEDFDRGVGADRVFWDSSQKTFRRTYQLEETRTYFLSSFMNEEGTITKYSLDVETAEDSHYEILPEKMAQLTQILQKKMNQKYLRNPAVSCAYFLQHHDGMDLLALLKEYP